MRILYLDCFSGISGDMLVGALTDLGVAPSVFEWELTKINLEDHHLHFERQTRKGIAGVKFGVHTGAVHVHTEQEPSHHDDHGHGDQDHHHHHDHHHEHHEYHHHHHDDGGSHHGSSSDRGSNELVPTGVHRTYRDIVQLINESDLSDFAKKHSLGVFQRLATAEAKVHACPVD